ncbi:MerR family transcriptional regulator [Streptomyces gamaensis]|uniref:MerR family transcriptional regulator n=1 Tax=Streptomyces gamaensis TaxID=1763542 RepID=A0ABW0Z4H3_9ACTN
MRSMGDGTAVGSPYPLYGGAVEQAPRHAVPAVTAPRVPGDDRIGYRGPTACAAAGITYRQLDYWARTGLVEPSVRPAHGSGTQRLYSFRDVVVLKIVKRLLDTGVSLQNIRTAVQHLRSRGMADLPQMTLMSDGATVYECTSPDEVVDLLQGGQGVFGIAVGVVWRDVEHVLSQLHGERLDTGETLIGHNPADELARRRNRVG